MKNTVISAALLLLFAGSAFAADGGGSPFDYSRVDGNAATAAMAGASMSNTENLAYGAFSNPAMLPFSSRTMGVGAGYRSWMPKYDGGNGFGLAGGYNNGRFGISAAGSYLMGSAYDVISDSGSSLGRYTPGEMNLGVGAGFRFAGNFSIGANVKYFRNSLTSTVAYNGFAADIAAAWANDNFAVTAGVMALGPKVKNFGMPTSAMASASYRNRWDSHGFLVEADADYYFSGAVSAAAGAQYSFADTIFVRAGYRFSAEGAPVPSHASVGLGVNFIGISLDVAYLLASETVGNTLMLGLGYSF